MSEGQYGAKLHSFRDNLAFEKLKDSAKNNPVKRAICGSVNEPHKLLRTTYIMHTVYMYVLCQSAHHITVNNTKHTSPQHPSTFELFGGRITYVH